MSVLKTPIDYKNLEEELHMALAADELYKLQNDAKIRAIEQGVPTYEHFRQMVEAAHLKPLDHDDVKSKFGVQWNPMIHFSTSHDSIAFTTSRKSRCDKENNKNIIKKSPDTCENFLQFWKTIENNSERFTYVWDLRNILRTHIFRIEIPVSFFSNFMDVCLQYLSNVDDIEPITEILSIFSACNRFNLTISFMTKDERSACEQLFQQLQLKGKSQNNLSENAIKSLSAKYGIELN